MLNIHIEQWTKTSQFIFVEGVWSDKEFDIRIDRDEFEAFLDRHCKLEWVNDSGLDSETWGTMTIEEYYETDYAEDDLKEFMAISEGVKIFDLIKKALTA